MKDGTSPRTEEPYPSYLSPKLTIRLCNDGRGAGVFAAEPIEKGELLAVWGGRIIDRASVAELAPAERRYVLQVGDNRYLASLDHVDPPDYINHCCRPNGGLRGEDQLVAMRKIAVGEEISFDYATTDSCPLLEFACECPKRSCRRRVSFDDWKRADVRARNRGYFSPYLQRRIDASKPVARGGVATDGAGAGAAFRQSDR